MLNSVTECVMKCYSLLFLSKKPNKFQLFLAVGYFFNFCKIPGRYYFGLGFLEKYYKWEWILMPWKVSERCRRVIKRVLEKFSREGIMDHKSEGRICGVGCFSNSSRQIKLCRVKATPLVAVPPLRENLWFSFIYFIFFYLFRRRKSAGKIPALVKVVRSRVRSHNQLSGKIGVGESERWGCAMGVRG